MSLHRDHGQAEASRSFGSFCFTGVPNGPEKAFQKGSFLFKMVPKKVKVEKCQNPRVSKSRNASLLLQCVPSQRPEHLVLLVTGFQRELAGTAH